MEISAKNLIEFGEEIDMPIELHINPPRQRTIKYDNTTKRFVLADTKTGEIHNSYAKLSDLIRVTNEIYDYHDKAIE